MPISFEHKFIFVHIPKNGGTSINKLFDLEHKKNLFITKNTIKENGISYAPQHLTAKLLKKHNISKDFFEEYFKFAFTRNPYDRVLSEFFWEGGNTEDEFHEWINSYYNVIDRDHKLSQYEYLYDDKGKLLVDFVGRLENIEVDFKKVLSTLKLPMKSPLHENKKKKKNINKAKYLTKETKAKIYDIYEIDFQTFNYKK